MYPKKKRKRRVKERVRRRKEKMTAEKWKEGKKECKRKKNKKTLYHFEWVHTGKRVPFHIFGFIIDELYSNVQLLCILR